MATTHELIDRAVRLASHEGCTNGFVATTCREAQEPIQEYCTGCLLERDGLCRPPPADRRPPGPMAGDRRQAHAPYWIHHLR
jgi:hypothetical protein